MHMSVAEIEKFIYSKRSWIEKHLRGEAPEHRRASRLDFKPGYGDTVLFRGRECEILASAAMNTGRPNRYKGEYKDGVFLIGEDLKAREIRFILSWIYKREASKYIPDRVKHFQSLMKLSPDSVQITSAFGRWGSCSAKKRLHFAWMLMMADDDAIDAVVVHELSHMIEANHSSAFYAVVRKYYPDYDAQHKKMKPLGRRIDQEHWKS
ncbi:metal-dependent hydrolase [Clostridia bacterium]|nr:metal-dependent hydrolase [Clostridia bacterium]